MFFEHYDGEFYTLRLFSPIEGEIYSLNSTEEGIHLTAYEMENYSSFIRDHMEGVGLLGKRNQKLMTYFNNAKRLHKPVEKAISDEIAQLIIKSIDYTEEHYGKTKYIFVKKDDPSKPFQYSMLQNRVMQMIRKNDIRDENGELLNFGTHTFRHCYGKKLTEMHIDDWMIARLLGHKTLQSVHHYRKIGNKIMADETRAVREKIDMILMDVVKEWDGYEI